MTLSLQGALNQLAGTKGLAEQGAADALGAVAFWARQSLTTGEAIFPRLACGNGITLTSGVMRLGYFTAARSETVTAIRAGTGGTAAAATPSLVRFGLYSIAADGTGTLVASTANDTTLFSATGTAYTKAFSTPHAKVAGQRYAVGMLVVTATTAPSVMGNGGIAGPITEFAQAPRLSGFIGGLADLPASFTDASLTGSAGQIYAVLTP